MKKILTDPEDTTRINYKMIKLKPSKRSTESSFSVSSHADTKTKKQ